LLHKAGWHVCDVADADLHAARGVAIREFPLTTGFGFADYLLYFDGKAVGVIEAKTAGATLTGVEVQSGKYAQRLPASETPWTRKLWIYDLRTNKHFTLKTNPLKCQDLDAFVQLYNPANRHTRKATWSAEANANAGTGPDRRWRVFGYNELVAGDKASLDIFWLKDESLADSDNLPPPEVIAQEIVDDLEAALEQFRLIAGDLNGSSRGDGTLLK
jgi:hypothetical protein